VAVNKCTEVCQYTCIQPMFYTLVAFLKKWVYVRNEIPLVNKGLAYNTASQRVVCQK